MVCFNVEFTLEQAYDLVRDAPVPVVFASAGSVNRPIWNVYYDNVDAGYQAAMHLLDRGCDDLLFVGQQGHPWVEERIQGVRAALAQRGVPERSMRTELAIPSLYFKAVGHSGAIAGLSANVPKGVIAANDHIAEGVYQAAHELGLVPGRDFLAVSFDDIPEARTLGVSSLRPPLEELGKGAARLAVCALNGDTTLQRTCLSSHLIVRDSSADAVKA
jgi:DNA-binding LacI/PurR family transcriptional regulator